MTQEIALRNTSHNNQQIKVFWQTWHCVLNLPQACHGILCAQWIAGPFFSWKESWKLSSVSTDKVILQAFKQWPHSSFLFCFFNLKMHQCSFLNLISIMLTQCCWTQWMACTPVKRNTECFWIYIRWVNKLVLAAFLKTRGYNSSVISNYLWLTGFPCWPFYGAVKRVNNSFVLKRKLKQIPFLLYFLPCHPLVAPVSIGWYECY